MSAAVIEIEIVAGERGDVPNAAEDAHVSASVNSTDTSATHTHHVACKLSINVVTPHYYTACIQHYKGRPYSVHDTPIS